jgi:uncharacterized membrane protein HdeD (DUF308 family)
MADASASASSKGSGWITVWGVLMIIAGILAIVVPAPAALAFALLLAWLLVFAGVVGLVHAFQQRAEDGFAWKVLSGVAPLALGILMLVNPIASIATLALVIGAFVFASGISSVMLAFRLRPKAGWGWVLFDGLLSIVIAVLIAMGWPQNSIGFVGILVGIFMISGGFWRIVLARALRSGAASTPSG